MTSRKTILKMIDAYTDFDVATVRFHRDGTISAVRDANKTFNGPETVRLVIGHVADFANGANPFVASE